MVNAFALVFAPVIKDGLVLLVSNHCVTLTVFMVHVLFSPSTAVLCTVVDA